MITEHFQQDLIDVALNMGAIDAKIFRIDDIVFDPRTILKCLFGCSGGVHYCPTAKDVPTSLTYPDIIKKYKWGIIICTNEIKLGQEITLLLEGKAFLAGYYFALGATECVNCDTCSHQESKPCVDRKKMRPPLYSLGIDVFKTARGLGWELEVVQNKGGSAKNITAVFVE